MRSFLAISFLLGLCGCGVLHPVKDRADHYLLDPMITDRPLTAATPAIAIHRPALPAYLDRQQWVTRTGGQIKMSSVDLWGEPLDSGISRVTAGNLSRLTGSMNIQPVENFTTLDYSHLLEIRIARFEPDGAQQLVLEGTWKLQPVSGAVAASHSFQIILQIPNNQTLPVARLFAMNTALELLARQISHHVVFP